ncbi:hypothetical protein [Falsibacillus pallidus]|uniref:hypothetical protein n=1 Tax=Falsibacillus pallidus TaxID=493781 RepID=UPI003D9532EA
MAYFKSNKIDYHYVKPIIKFPCMDCEEEAVMHAMTTNWSCSSCGASGTISKLIATTSDTWKKSKIYNPHTEKNKIMKLFDDLQANSNSKKMQTLKSRVSHLIEYYESKMP